MHRALVNILESKARSMRVARLAVLLSLAAMAAARLRLIVLSWNADYLYLRDSVQYYLMGKALLVGEYLYQPMNVLALKFTEVDWYYHHPSPYPPTMALFCAPLGLIDLLTVPKVWFILGLGALFAAAIMLAGWYRQKLDWAAILTLILVTLAWHPTWLDLIQGQVSIILLTILTAAWLLTRRGEKFAGGVLLGLSVCIKLVAWPVLLYYLIKRQWRILAGAAATALVMHAAVVFVMGFEPVWDYYMRVTGEVLPYYQGYWYNVSLWSLGWRLFAGTDSQMLVGPIAPPLTSLPWLAPVFSALVMLAVLGVSLYWAYRSGDEDSAYAIMVCVSLLISPISWIHYYSMALVALVIAIHRLKEYRYPIADTWALACLMLVLFLSTEWIQSLVRNSMLTGAEVTKTPFGLSMLNLLPAAALLGLIALLRRLGRLAPPAESHV